MAVHRIGIRSSRRVEMIDITEAVENAVRESGVTEGLVIVSCLHTTAGLTINENADPDVVRDMTAHLATLVPENGDFAHAEGNSDAHIKSSLLGASLPLIVEDGRLTLGTWQGLYFCECDGPRQREVRVKVMAG